MLKRPVYQMSPGLQFLLFVVVFAAVFLIGNILGLVAIIAIYGLDLLRQIGNYNFSDPQTAPALYLLQILSMTVPIFIAPIIFSYKVTKKPKEYLRAGFRIPWVLFVVVLFVMMVSLPVIELLSNINQQMVLPQWLHGIEQWMKESEESARQLTNAILQMRTVWDCVKNILLIGLLTAIAEEFMFRGAMQTIFLKWTKNPHVAVWLTAAIFSAFHLEFYGFLPRLLLGALFGYFVIYSGSTWPAVWGHFLNNGWAVVATYLYQIKAVKLNPDDAHLFSYPVYLFSGVIIIILLLVFKKIAQGKERPVLNGEELG